MSTIGMGTEIGHADGGEGSAHASLDYIEAPEWLGTGELECWLALRKGVEGFLDVHSDGIGLADVIIRMSFYLIDLVGDIDLAEPDEIEGLVGEAVRVVANSVASFKCGNFWELYCDYVQLGFADPTCDEMLYRRWVEDYAADPERISDVVVAVEECGEFGEWFDRLFLLDGVRVFDALMNTYEYLL